MGFLLTRGALIGALEEEGFQYLGDEGRSEDFIDRAALQIVTAMLWPDRIKTQTLTADAQAVTDLGPVLQVRIQSDGRLKPLSPTTLQELYDEGRSAQDTGAPLAYFLRTGLLNIYPAQPGAQVIEVDHYSMAPWNDGFSPDTDSTPLIPIAFRDIIFERAKALAYTDNGDQQDAQACEMRVAVRMKEAAEASFAPSDEAEYVHVRMEYL